MQLSVDRVVLGSEIYFGRAVESVIEQEKLGIAF